MYIVVNSYNTNHFRNIKEFKLDLGESVFTINGPKNRNLTVNDDNVYDYGNRHERFCQKIGSIGRISVYTDDIHPRRFIGIYDNSNTLETEMDTERFRSDTRNYLNELIHQLVDTKNAETTQMNDEDRLRLWREQMDK